MLRLFLSFAFSSLTAVFFSLNAQAVDPNPVQWIAYNQTYYKIPVAEPGIYRVNAVELVRAGIPVDRIDPSTLQLFHRGVEQAILVSGESDHRFDSNDFLEFYGEKNDGAQDSLLYRPRSARPHPYYSLFNDTTAYFLTWRLDGKPGKRMALQTDTTTTLLTPDAYHWAEEVRLFTTDYPGWAAGLPGKTEYSYYEAGEGYTGPVQQKNHPTTIPFQLMAPVRTGPDPQIDVLVVGREVINHQITCLTGFATDQLTPVDSVRFAGYANASMQFRVNWSVVDANGRFVVSTVSGNEATARDAYSVSYLRLRYPQQLTANGQSIQRFELLPNALGRSLLTISHVLPATDFWDITDPDTPIRLNVLIDSAATARLVVQGTTRSRILLASRFRKSIAGLYRITFTNWSGRKPTYVIISHESLMKPATSPTGEMTTNAVQAYAAYRASKVGGGFDTLTVTMQQLIDQFSYGERHPLAIRRFIRQFLRTDDVSPYLLLIGRGRSGPGVRNDPQQAMLDLVMTAGYPGSDTWFSAELTPDEPDIPAVPTGRINAATPQEVMNYLEKVRDYEKRASNHLWRKQLMHLSGGLSPNERNLFRQLVDTYRDQAVGPSLGASVTTVSKAGDQPVELPGIAKTVNEGVGLITFFGHSGLDVTDLDIGFCSNEALGYRNEGKYPFLLVNGCAIGNVFYGRPTLSTDWVLTPNRGAIAALAHSHLGTVDELHSFTSTFYNLLTDSTQLNRSIGQLHLETIRRLLTQTTNQKPLATCQQMILQGDPAIRLFPFTTPDYVLNENTLTVEANTGQPLTLLSDSVRIRMVVDNTGQFRPGRLPFLVRRWVNGQQTDVFNLTLSHATAFRDTLTLTLPNDRTAEGANRFEVLINPAGQLTTQPERNRTNNQAQIDLILTSPKPALIYPPPSATVTTTSVQLMAQYIQGGSHSFVLELDSSAHFNSPFRTTQTLTAQQFISYIAHLPNRPNVTFHWRVRLADTPSVFSDTVAWAVGSFVYAPSGPSTGLPEAQLQATSQLPADIHQGDRVSIPVQLTNLSPYPFSDSLVVQQTIYATALSAPQRIQWRIAPPKQTDTIRFSITIPTDSFPGRNRVRLTVNPYLQPEYSYQNNTIEIPLTVIPDELGPLLEVAFDGARIPDGAVVSSSPLLDILVVDDNRSLIRQDTTGLSLFLQKPGSNVPFDRLNWRHAIQQSMEKGNSFRLRYPLPRLTEGVYHLTVTAYDAVGNAAVPYQTGFRVISQKLLNRFSVSPNPFQALVRFGVELTGEKAPNRLSLRFTDLNGRLVRTLAPIARIGLNELIWDGRDETGKLLPAGIYLYQLMVLDDTGEAWPVAGQGQSHLRGRIVFSP